MANRLEWPATSDGKRRAALAAAALLACALAPRAAAAQRISGFALDRFEPAAAGSRWLSLDSLDFEGHLRPAFSSTVDWAWKPLVFYDPGGHELGALVRQQAVVNLNAAVALWNRARVDLNLPLPIASGDDVRILDRSYGAPEGGGLGDVRLGADVRIFGAPHGRLTGAVGAQLFVPTGRNRSFSGDGGLRFWPRFMLAGERGRLVWAARAGVHLRPGDACGCDLAPGSELTLGGAVGWQLRPRLLLGAELYGSAALSGGGAFAGAAPPAELLLGGQLALKPRWRINAGIAPGLTDGPGSPGLRAVVGLQFDVGAPAQAPSPVPTAVPPWTATPAGP